MVGLGEPLAAHGIVRSSPSTGWYSVSGSNNSLGLCNSPSGSTVRLSGCSEMTVSLVRWFDA